MCTTVRFIAVFKIEEPHDAVRRGFEEGQTLPCGSVRFPKIVNATARFAFFMYIFTVRFGAVFRNLNEESYGANWCGFKEGENPTVRFGAVKHTDPHGTDKRNRTVKNPAFCFGWFLSRI